MAPTKSCSCLILFAAAMLIPLPAGSYAEEPNASPPAATLNLTNGDFIAGQLKESNRSNVLRWQCGHFSAPFDFDLKTVCSIHFPSPHKRPKPEGKYCFELRGGDLIFGSLVEINAKEVVANTPRFGRLHIQRARIERITRGRDAKSLIYAGPNGLSEWDELSPEDAWQQNGNHLSTQQDAACLIGDVQIPPLAHLEIELSWSQNPDFMLALGTCGKEHDRAFRIETWDSKLVCLWETEDEADIAVLKQAPLYGNRCHLSIYLDQTNHRATVFSKDGQLLANIGRSENKLKPGTGIYLLNRHGNLRFEQLRVMKCSGAVANRAEATKSHVLRADGSTVFGEIERFDAVKNEFVIDDKDKETRIDASNVECIAWAQADEPVPHGICVCLQDGARFGGKLRNVKNGRLWIDCPGVAEPLGAGISDMQSVSVSDHSKPTGKLAKDRTGSEPETSKDEPILAENTPKHESTNTNKGRKGILEMTCVRLHGVLIDGADLSQNGCLAWQPRCSMTASVIKPGESGRIAYRSSMPDSLLASKDPKTTNAKPQNEIVGIARFMGALAGVSSKTGTPPPIVKPILKRSTAKLHLRSGDTIPCKIKRIDKRGLWFESTLYETSFVPHERIKAINLINASRDTRINPTKRERLLTLPRMRKENPPTHLIRSVDGDYLRANLISMDEETLTVEYRLERRQFPRKFVTRIIWLHSGNARSDPADTSKTRVQAVKKNGHRVTFTFEKLAATKIIGASDTLGKCSLKLDEIDQLIFGDISKQTAKSLPYQRWQLQPAKDPKFVQKDAGPETRAKGTESELVGKEAPDFKLDNLNGKQFCLSAQRGKIVVLDFWATWCGACIQALPQIDHLVNQHKNQDVILIAVDLQETPETVRATLNRLKLETTVVIDQDGVVAEKYATTAIPQTVIIDRSGKIRRLFVGGGPQYVERLHEALREILSKD